MRTATKLREARKEAEFARVCLADAETYALEVREWAVAKTYLAAHHPTVVAADAGVATWRGKLAVAYAKVFALTLETPETGFNNRAED